MKFKIRIMSEPEYDLVKTKVFKDTLPERKKIYITDIIGRGNRAFVISANAIGKGLAHVLATGPAKGFMTQWYKDGWLINVGSNYPSMIGTADKEETLVHECVHVWQGHNSIFPLSYVASALLAQGVQECGGDDAYGYVAGKPFDSYNSEAQGAMVEAWFKSGCPESGDLWPYVRDNIRKGKK